MSARHKLNAAHFSGTLIVAALLGAVAGSWTVFLVTAALLLLANLMGQDIRLGDSGRR